MKQFSNYTALLLAGFFIFSCKNKDQSSSQQFYHPKPASIFATYDNAGVRKFNPAHGQPGHRCDIPDGAPLPATTVSAENAAKFASALSTTPATGSSAPVGTVLAGNTALNPKHGLPGHRCDIAEGAPLNSVPATTSTTLPAGGSSSKLNPAHGQPGHRCDIAVGAPLDSKPAATTTTNPTTTSSTTTFNPTTPVSTSPGSLKNNPSHGQPGHRCDIAVGAPLDSKPAAKTNNSLPSPLQPAISSGQDSSQKTTISFPDTATGKSSARLNPPHGQPGHNCSIAVGKPLNQ